MEYSVPEFILDIYACLYQEVDLHAMISVMYAHLSVLLNCAPSAYLREMDTVIIILRISA